MIVSSKIILDWEELKLMDQGEAYYTILHELSHSFGFDDVYYNGKFKNYNYNNGNTSMNNQNDDFVVFYPNDYAALQVLYSNEYLKQDNKEEALDVIKDKISKYEEHFYYHFANKLKEEDENLKDAYKEQLTNVCSLWRRTDVKGVIRKYEFNIKN